MSHTLRPTHEAGMAVALMTIGLAGILFAIVYGNTTETPQPDPAASYRGPVLQIKAACRRIDERLAAHTSLGDIEKIYKPARLTQFQPLKTVEKPADNKKESAKTVTPKQQNTKLKLTGIAWSPNCPLAFINGESVMVGESISGWKVISITPERVNLDDGGGKHRALMLYCPQTEPGKQTKEDTEPPLL